MGVDLWSPPESDPLGASKVKRRERRPGGPLGERTDQLQQSAVAAKSIGGSSEPAVRVGHSRVKNALNERRWGGPAVRGYAGPSQEGRRHPAPAPFPVPLYLQHFVCVCKQTAEGKLRPAGDMTLRWPLELGGADEGRGREKGRDFRQDGPTSPMAFPPFPIARLPPHFPSNPAAPLWAGLGREVNTPTVERGC